MNMVIDDNDPFAAAQRRYRQSAKAKAARAKAKAKARARKATTMARKATPISCVIDIYNRDLENGAISMADYKTFMSRVDRALLGRE